MASAHQEEGLISKTAVISHVYSLERDVVANPSGTQRQRRYP